jgi:uncharacterized protein YciI
MFVVLITYKEPLEIIEKHLAAHRAYLDIGFQKNYLVVSGPKNPRTGGVLLSQLTDRRTLDLFISQDPYVLNDVADYEVIEFTPVKWQQAFAVFVGQ